MLRRSATAILLGHRNNTDHDDGEDGGDNGRPNKVVQGVMLSSVVDDENDEGFGQRATAAKRISSTHVVVADSCVEDIPTSKQRVIRRISVIAGKPLGRHQQHRHVVIVPPHVFPPYQTTAVHCLLLDETAQVAPILMPHGCTVLHITTTVHAGLVTVDAGNELLATIASTILGSAQQQRQHPPSHASGGSNSNESEVREVFFTNFSYDVKTAADAASIALAAVPGLHVIRRPRPGLTADACFEQAKAIFTAICPGQAFLEVSQSMKDTIREALGEEALNKEEDDVERILESAAGLLNHQQQHHPPTVDATPTATSSSVAE
jgi:hypothetical protein